MSEKTILKRATKSSIDMLWRLKNKRLFKKTYASYDEALDNCRSHLGFEQDDLVRVMIRKTEVVAQKLFKEKDDSFNNLTINAFLCSFAFKEGAVYVLDFGGGSGLHYHYFKSVFGKSIKVKWCVVETALMCKYVNHLQTDELFFFDNIQDALKSMGKVDLVLSSGTLQYINDPVKTIHDLMKVDANYIIFSRLNLIVDHPTVITIQHSLLRENGPGELPEGFVERDVEYPNTILNEDEFLKTIHENYRIKFKMHDSSGVYKINTYHVIGYSVLFEKRSTTNL